MTTPADYARVREALEAAAVIQERLKGAQIIRLADAGVALREAELRNESTEAAMLNRVGTVDAHEGAYELWVEARRAFDAALAGYRALEGGGIMQPTPDVLALLDALLAEASPLPWVVHLPGSYRVCNNQHDTEDGCKTVMSAEILYGMIAHAAHNARLTTLATDHLRPFVAAALWANNEDNHAEWCGAEGNLCPPCAALAALAAALGGGEENRER